jgi:hydrogenase nickel incorporation protein HypA/HybF
MHELAVTQNILDTSIRHAQAAKAQKILSIKIIIGQFASIVDDSVAFYWDLIAKGTIAQEAILEFERVPAQFTCQDCAGKFLWEDNLISCPRCNSNRIKIESGTELFIDSIMID